MNLVETMLSAVKGDVGQQLASQFGLNTNQTGSVITALAPVLAAGLKEKLASGSGSGLLDLLKGGTLQQYADNPAAISSPQAAQTGQSILGQLFGGGNLLNGIATAAAEKSGVDSSLVQKMLPILATLFMAFVSKSATDKDGQVDTSNLNHTLGSIAGEHHGVFDALKTAAGKIFS